MKFRIFIYTVLFALLPAINACKESRPQTLSTKPVTPAIEEKLFQVYNLIDSLPQRRLKRYPSRKKVSMIIIHHTARDNQEPVDYAKYHVEKRRWSFIAYHFVIDSLGYIYQCNPLDRITNHTGKWYNAHSIGIAMMGNLHEHPPRREQFESLIFLINTLRKRNPDIKSIKGHREVFPRTVCPGKYLDMDSVRQLTNCPDSLAIAYRTVSQGPLHRAPVDSSKLKVTDSLQPLIKQAYTKLFDKHN